MFGRLIEINIRIALSLKKNYRDYLKYVKVTMVEIKPNKGSSNSYFIPLWG